MMRIKNLQKSLQKKKIDLALIFSLDEEPNTNMMYFADYKGMGLLAVPKSKKPFLIVPNMEYEKALATNIKVYKIKRKKKFFDTLSTILGKTEINKIGIEESKLSVFLYKKLKKELKVSYTDISKICSEIRMIKDADELKNIAYACHVTDYVFNKIACDFRFKTEQEIKNFIESEFRDKKCELAFKTIAASGTGSSQPHYDNSKKLEKGFLVLDFGAKYSGYCADMTRMFYLGKPSKRELDDYNLVLKTVLLCEKAAEVKKKFSDLHKLSIKILDRKAKHFVHSLGHGVGLDIHEIPGIYSEDKTNIQNNIVFTIEPGIYFPGKYGIRIEDTCVLQNRKLELLTQCKKELVVIS